MSSISLSYVSGQPHLVLTHRDWLGASIVCRLPEFVRSRDQRERIFPGDVETEMVRPGVEIRYRWAAPDQVKRRLQTDFHGHAWVEDDVVRFELAGSVVGPEPGEPGLYLVCLQCGQHMAMQDQPATRTYLRSGGRWRTVAECVGSAGLPDHRMFGSGNPPVELDRVLMARVTENGWVVGIGIDGPGSVSSNHQPWPSCIHANPAWPTLGAGEEATVRGVIHWFQGTLDELWNKVQNEWPDTASGDAPDDHV